MTETVKKSDLPPFFPDHTQLPESDGTFVKNFQEHPQSLLLTDSLTSTLQRLHPDGYYCIGQDCGIYWRETDPPEKGAEAPDWFYVANVPPKLQGQYRRSYVIWREHIAPTIVLEFASGDGSEERDRTPLYRSDRGDVSKPGKFWVYEQIIRAPYYGIFSIQDNSLEVYHHVDGFYQPMTPNDRGHYPIPPMQVELGIWEGTYQNQTQQWLRWWDLEGNLLLIGQEEAQKERQKRQQLEEKVRSLSPEQLASLGIDWDAIG
ncbi:Uma2 family endonuclease [Oxynema aestuarii]|jgi:Uma2 family endonuclease|uniref:Uma2 family endonuclease n=1 Tax=Oxynema aestuarii AP17 TaxID=2064643 RepID=A0A6H1TWT7_9CYAN|nr:Uma2 family endonuclease [Oxynema aestuarii]QIZ70607.1 Uma2 family endonuclease [Oxynema aestuarii AP17]RMH78116.1 MAG: Uma2 family endonuclease [Cyanobacteria bacterium J007]